MPCLDRAVLLVMHTSVPNCPASSGMVRPACWCQVPGTNPILSSRWHHHSVASFREMFVSDSEGLHEPRASWGKRWGSSGCRWARCAHFPPLQKARMWVQGAAVGTALHPVLCSDCEERMSQVVAAPPTCLELWAEGLQIPSTSGRNPAISISLFGPLKVSLAIKPPCLTSRRSGSCVSVSHWPAPLLVLSGFVREWYHFQSKSWQIHLKEKLAAQCLRVVTGFWDAAMVMAVVPCFG